MARDASVHLPRWLRELTPYQPGKPIDELEREYGITDSIKLASNENPLGPSPLAIQALRRSLGDVHRYPDGGAFHLTRKLSAKLGVSPEQLIVGNGSNEIIELIVRAFVRPGDEVVMADQAFVIYRMVVQAAAATPRLVPLRNFTHDLEGMAAAVTPRTRAVFLANPNNPTGTIYTREPWETFLANIPPRVLVVADDAYAEFVGDPAYADSLAYHGPGRLLITLRTLSKIYGLAGLRVGYGVSRPDVIDALHRIRQPFNVNALAQVAATAALDDEQHVARTREMNREGMAFLQRECERLGLPTVPSWANFLLIDVGQGAEVYEALLREGVIVRPMGVYRFPRHIRATVGTMDECERFIGALERAVASAAGPSSRPKRASVSTASVGGQALFRRMAVIGVGLIGGSLAMAAKRAGLVGSAVGCARSEATLRVAREREMVDEVFRDPGQAVRGADLVVLAVPVGAMGSVAAAIRADLSPGTVVTDVGSVKTEMMRLLEPICREASCSFVGGHPIAGSESAGAAAADADLFAGHRCILTPTAAANAAVVNRIRRLWEGVGMRVEEMDAGTHDRILARVSHAPHLVAYALTAAVAGAQAGSRVVSSYAGSGFRDTTRIAASSPELWRDITFANQREILDALQEFECALRTLRDLVRQGDRVGLERALAAAAAQRRGLLTTSE